MSHLERAILSAVEAGQIQVVESWIGDVYRFAKSSVEANALEGFEQRVEDAFAMRIERIVEIEEETVIVEASIEHEQAIALARRLKVEPRGLVRIKATSAQARMALAAAAAEDEAERSKSPRLRFKGNRA